MCGIESVPKSAPIDVLHDDVGNSILLSPPVYVDHAAVGEVRLTANLFVEAIREVGILHHTGVGNLYYDIATEFGVTGKINSAHPAGAEHAFDPVTPILQGRTWT
jgi:hypothetical protein